MCMQDQNIHDIACIYICTYVYVQYGSLFFGMECIHMYI